MTIRVPVQVKLLHPTAVVGVPKYATAHSTAADLSACLSLCSAAKPDEQGVLTVRIQPGSMAMIPSGLAVRPAPGYATKVAARSGLALKKQITLQNGVALIDHDYSNGIGILLRNEGVEPFDVKDGDRIAQLEVHEVIQGDFILVDELNAPEQVEGFAERSGGFGSSGINGASAYSVEKAN